MPRLKVSGNKEVRELVKWAEDELGYVAERTGGGHIRFLHDDVAQPIFCSSSPSDYRARRNVEALLISALAEVSNKEFKRDPLLLDDVEVVPGAAFICPSCRNHGVEKIFVHPQGLASHMSEEHPAPPLEPEPELEAAPSERAEEEEPVPNEEVKNPRPNPVRVEELEALLEKLLRDGEIVDGLVTLEMLRERFPGRFVDTAVMAMKKRKDGDWIRLRHGGKKGQYRIVRPKTEKWSWSWSSPSSPEENGVFPPPVFAEAKIFEEINRFVDGKLLLRDAEGHLYQAEIERLS